MKTLPMIGFYFTGKTAIQGIYKFCDAWIVGE